MDFYNHYQPLEQRGFELLDVETQAVMRGEAVAADGFDVLRRGIAPIVKTLLMLNGLININSFIIYIMSLA